MTPSTQARTALIELLGTMAGYNDKGWYWSRHTPADIATQQAEAQVRVLDLVAGIGDEAFSRRLLKQLKSGKAVRDGSGLIRDQARRELMA